MTKSNLRAYMRVLSDFCQTATEDEVRAMCGSSDLGQAAADRYIADRSTMPRPPRGLCGVPEEVLAKATLAFWGEKQ